MDQQLDFVLGEIENVIQKGGDVFLDIDFEVADTQAPSLHSDQKRIAALAALEGAEESLMVAAIAGESLAYNVAARFFRCDLEEVDARQAHEGMAELVNIFTGNMNALISDSRRVTTPV
ncbi:MAG: hypothetical protein ABEK29_07950, partial [Bradymonadaceae bacterium]